MAIPQEKVLFVDDCITHQAALIGNANLGTTGILTSWAKQRGDIQLDSAVTGEEAVNKFKEGYIKLIIMDSQMPVKDGITAAREIRAYAHTHYPTHKPPVILSYSSKSPINTPRTVYKKLTTAHSTTPEINAITVEDNLAALEDIFKDIFVAPPQDDSTTPEGNATTSEWSCFDEHLEKPLLFRKFCAKVAKYLPLKTVTATNTATVTATSTATTSTAASPSK